MELISWPPVSRVTVRCQWCLLYIYMICCKYCLFQVPGAEVKTEKAVIEDSTFEKLSDKSEMADMEEDRHRSARQNLKNVHSRARSFESEEERKALLTLRQSQS